MLQIFQVAKMVTWLTTQNITISERFRIYTILYIPVHGADHNFSWAVTHSPELQNNITSLLCSVLSVCLYGVLGCPHQHGFPHDCLLWFPPSWACRRRVEASQQLTISVRKNITQQFISTAWLYAIGHCQCVVKNAESGPKPSEDACLYRLC